MCKRNLAISQQISIEGKSIYKVVIGFFFINAPSPRKQQYIWIATNNYTRWSKMQHSKITQLNFSLNSSKAISLLCLDVPCDNGPTFKSLNF